MNCRLTARLRRPTAMCVIGLNKQHFKNIHGNVNDVEGDNVDPNTSSFI